jgi:hypothetical protein
VVVRAMAVLVGEKDVLTPNSSKYSLFTLSNLVNDHGG